MWAKNLSRFLFSLFRFNRQTDPALEREIDKTWTERVSKEPWLFNGSKFRLHSFCLASLTSVSPKHPSNRSHGSRRLEENVCTSNCLHHSAPNSLDERNGPAENTDEHENGLLLTLRLGLTCYKDYLGTNWSCRVPELRQLGETDFGDPLALLAQPLGVGGVLCTANGQVVLIRRSQKVAEAGGLLDMPGGHPEPKVKSNKSEWCVTNILVCYLNCCCPPQAVCERLGQTVREEQISVGMMKPRAVVSELFSSVCAEIRDEVGFPTHHWRLSYYFMSNWSSVTHIINIYPQVNIPLSSLGQPVLMGVALNHTSAGRASAEFYVRYLSFSFNPYDKHALLKISGSSGGVTKGY